MAHLLNPTPNDMTDWNAQSYKLAKGMRASELYLLENRGGDGQPREVKAFAFRDTADAHPRDEIWRLLWRNPVTGNLSLVSHKCQFDKPKAPKIASVPKAC